MIFIVLTFIAAFIIEGLGTAVSVIGLSTLFGSNPIIISLAIALDYGKLIVVSLLYTHWKKLSLPMKSYALAASVVTMIITSAGIAGYLSAEFQKAIIGTQEVALKVDVLKKQQAKYEERKRQIDDQIAKLPEKTTVNQRIRLINAFRAEQKDLQNKINEIDKQLPTAQVEQINVEAKAGPILYISKAFDVPVEVAVKYVISMITFVFDPLAVFLIIAGNFLLHLRRAHKEVKMTDADLFEESLDVKAELMTAPMNPTADRSKFDQAFFSTSEELGDAAVKMARPTVQEPMELTPAPMPEPAPEPTREEITLDQLRQSVAASSLKDVKPDDSVVFDPAPDGRSFEQYRSRWAPKNLK